MAKKIANHAQQEKQATAREIEQEIPQRNQQHNSKMVPYLSLQRMMQSVWRRGQQQLRDGCCSQVAARSSKETVWGLSVDR